MTLLSKDANVDSTVPVPRLTQISDWKEAAWKELMMGSQQLTCQVGHERSGLQH